jgi:pimeloyl-ACP methyl ester carboxylesterase
MASANATWRSGALGEAKRVELPQGTLPCHDTGSGPTVFFVHGAMVNANVWRKVVEALAGDFRCVVPDLPFGAHLEPAPPDADFSPPALADWIADAIDALQLDDVTLVGNDTGGALCQILIARRPERVGRLVLTSCDAFENFPPKALRPALPVMKLPGVMTAVSSTFRIGGLRHRAGSLMGVIKHPVEARASDSYFLPLLRREIRRDFVKLLNGMDERYTLEAAEHFPEFDRPVLIAWSREDKFFDPKFAERLAGAFPKAGLEWIDDAYTISPEDQPERLAEAISRFIREPAAIVAGP